VFLHPTKTPQNNLPQWSARSYAQPWTNDYDWCGEFQPRKPVAEPRNPVLDWDVDSLDLCVRSRMALARDSVKTVQQLVEMSAAQLLRIPKFGQTSLNELRECLAKHTLRLKDDL
jgi:DNA-directed RNA polymerase alpha subunit